MIQMIYMQASLGNKLCLIIYVVISYHIAIDQIISAQFMQEFREKINYQSPDLKPHSSLFANIQYTRQQPQDGDNSSMYLANSFQSTTRYSLGHLNSIFFKNGKIYNLLARSTERKVVKCGCVKSFCQARYCQCYRSGQICGKDCVCRGCKNTLQNQKSRLSEKNTQMLSSTLPPISIINPQTTQIIGCRCKKSGCSKKYCECFQNGKKCGAQCACLNCENGNINTKDQQINIKKQKNSSIKQQKYQNEQNNNYNYSNNEKNSNNDDNNSDNQNRKQMIKNMPKKTKKINKKQKKYQKISKNQQKSSNNNKTIKIKNQIDKIDEEQQFCEFQLGSEHISDQKYLDNLIGSCSHDIQTDNNTKDKMMMKYIKQNINSKNKQMNLEME